MYEIKDDKSSITKKGNTDDDEDTLIRRRRTSHCVFCLKPTTTTTTTTPCSSSNKTDLESSSSSSSVPRIRRALTFLERHLKMKPGGGGGGPPLLLEFSSSVCGKCAPILDTFSSLYEGWKELELKLDWELSKLKNVVQEANHVPMRGTYVKELYQEVWGAREGLSMMKEMYNWRRQLSTKCSHKLSSSLPKVVLPKLEEEETPPLPTQEAPEGVTTTITPSYYSVHIRVRRNGGGGREAKSIEATNQQVSKVEVTPTMTQQEEEEADHIDIKYEFPNSPLFALPPPEEDPLADVSYIENSPSSFQEEEEKPEDWTTTNRESRRAGRAIRADDHGHLRARQRFYCSKCPKWYFTKPSRNLHLKSHNLAGLAPAEVRRCEAAGCSAAAFRTPRQLYKHRREFHARKSATTGKYSVCLKCGEEFQTQHQLMLHRQAQHQLLQHECPECGQRFSTTTTRDRHVLWKHSGPDSYPFACDKCGKRFPIKWAFRRHMKTMHHKTKKQP